MAGIKFRVLLDSNQKEEVFCDILLSIDDNFESFFNTIIKAYDFKGDQMASFYASNEEWDKGEEVSLMDVSFGEEGQQRTMSNTSIQSMVEAPDQKFILVYDFMKMWRFLVTYISKSENNKDHSNVIYQVGKMPESETEIYFESNNDISENRDELEDEYY